MEFLKENDDSLRDILQRIDLDRGLRTVTQEGKSIRLSQRECLVMEYLLRNARLGNQKPDAH